ncbi:AAA family ATPase [Endomicrobium proavitum]|uniref:Cytidylate kinase n=1 Tax=Endomicrobium proavitum TaxID=1408281 RepID=A0A0G3WKJ4_9BACT|nr:cytidylate kinase-like family protein [Endomicrobium proavitum]AKL98407.1 hypothetical protein Epro_1028 [Endomicrobium proavitum]
MSKKFVITIARQYGSGGLVIGKKLSEDFGIAFYDKALIEIAAKKSGLMQDFIEKSDEKTSLWFLGGISDFLANGLGADYSPSIKDSIFKIQSDIIRALARKDSAVFVGRCADYVLRDCPNKISIFISANVKDRVKNISAQLGVGEDKALKEIEKIDKQRNKYYEYYTNMERGNAAYYDLCVNSSVLGISKTAELIKKFIQQVIGNGRGVRS